MIIAKLGTHLKYLVRIFFSFMVLSTFLIYLCGLNRNTVKNISFVVV